jgi:alkyl hydroperoxide reductase subunit AhpC
VQLPSQSQSYEQEEQQFEVVLRSIQSSITHDQWIKQDKEQVHEA